MRILLLSLSFALWTSSYADSPPKDRRDKAIAAVTACLRRNEVSSQECKGLSENIATLVEVYKQGDKSVLPTLFHFPPYLIDFYGDAFLADPDFFLATMARLPERDQKPVAESLAGGMPRLNRQRFEDIRTLLTAVPDESANKPIAQRCLRALKRNNASLLLAYFPPRTFTARGGEFQVRGYSSALYALGQKPMWPPSSTHETIYRFTHLEALSDQRNVVTLTVRSDGTGLINIKAFSRYRDVILLDKTATVSPARMDRFFSLLDQAHFWTLPAESARLGLDGAEWMLEGVKEGNYHVVTRWCPGSSHSAEDRSFAHAARSLFELAGHGLENSC